MNYPAKYVLLFVSAWVIFMFGAYVHSQSLPDPAKLAPVYQQQRNAEADGRAQCFALVLDQQARIAELEKQLAAAKAATGEKP
jgi:hypothetical protein